MPNSKRAFSQRDESPTPPRLPQPHPGLFTPPRPDFSTLQKAPRVPTQDEIMTALLSETSLNAYNNRVTTWSDKYHQRQRQNPSKKLKPFVRFDQLIDKNALFHRYSLPELQTLLTPLNGEEKNKITAFKAILSDLQLNVLNNIIQDSVQVDHQDRRMIPSWDSGDEDLSLDYLDNFVKLACEARERGAFNNKDEHELATDEDIKKIAQYLLRNSIYQHIKKHHSLGFRFAVIDNNEQTKILFSIGTSSGTMSHSQLASGMEQRSECLAAGEIRFQHIDNSPRIETISNRTGHFECTPSTLLFPLNCLFTSIPTWFGNEVEFVLYDNSSQSTSTIIDVNLLKDKYQQKIGHKMLAADQPGDGLNTICFYAPRLQRDDHAPRPVLQQPPPFNPERYRGERRRFGLFQQQPIVAENVFSLAQEEGSDSEEEDSTPSPAR